MNGTLVHRLARVLVAPRAGLCDPADRHRARLLAAILLALFSLGLASGLLQLALVPGFAGTFIYMLPALAVIAGAYWASRSRFFCAAAWTACLTPVAACFGIVATRPADTVAGCFMLLGVLLASAFLGSRATLAAACTAFVALASALALQSGPLDLARAVPLLAFHAVLSPLLVITSFHRDALEHLREAASRQRDAAAHEQRQLELLGRLAGGIAHDFNNLLLVVQANAELLGRSGDAWVRSLTEDVRIAAIRGAGLTRQLLAAARKQPLQPEPVPVNALLSSMEVLLRRLIGSHITLVVKPADTDGTVLADRSQLEQVVLNLALNGRDAMPNGGLLRLEARRGAPGALHEGRDSICLSVSDTGVGMDASTVQRVGEPFFTTKGASGHGLGLATVRGIVKQSGGRLEITSAPGQGSRFDVFLPLTTSSPLASELRSARLPASVAQKATILMLEDDQAVLRAVRHMLEDMGHHVLAAQSAGEAIALFEREHGSIDLLLTDLLVSAIHGVDVAALLTRRRPGLRVLFMSAYSESMLDAARTIPAAGLIAKPFSMEELDTSIQRCLGTEPGKRFASVQQPAVI